MVQTTYDEIYSVLSFTEWKNGRAIKEELDKFHKVEDRRFRQVSYGSLYTKLRRLVEEGWAEVRDSEDEDGRIREYKRYTGKLRIPDKEKKAARQVFGGLEGLVPA
ncbi:MAG: helix-turn-helix transcriptional regulator [Candidatus Woesearchaeota archaeon]|nr:helix-turn-helix transcriptional regulator [Candidatus Woesearchaeota archaeon]